MFPVPPIAIFAFAAAALAVISGVIVYRQAGDHHSVAAIGFGAAAIAGGLWVGGYGTILVFGIEYGLWSITFMVPGAVAFGVAWFVFVISYAGYENAVNRQTIPVLAAIPVVLIALAATNHAHRLFVFDTRVGTIAGQDALVLTYGTGYALYAAYMLTLGFVGVALLGQTLRGTHGIYRKQLSILLIGTVLPLFGILFSLFGIGTPAVNATPFLVVVSIALVLFGTFTYAIFDVRPIARDEVVQWMRDAIVVVDESDTIIEANPAARSGLGLAEDPIGDDARSYRPLRATLDHLDGAGDHAGAAFDGGATNERVRTDSGLVTSETDTDAASDSKGWNVQSTQSVDLQHLPSVLDDDAAIEGQKHLDLAVQTPDGEIRNFLVRAQSVGMTATEECRLFVLHDVTARRKTEAQFKALIEHTSDVITVLDGDGRHRYCSPSMERQLGYDPVERLEKNAFELVHEDDRAEAKRWFRSVVETGGDSKARFRLRQESGLWRTYECVALNRLETPEIEGVVISARDVTETHRYERKLKVMNRVLRHDLRNDMNVVLGHAELLSEADSAAKLHAEPIRRKAESLVTLGEKVRRVDEHFARTPSRTPIDLSALVTEEVTEIGERFPAATV
ncbi:MAG: histidine kinase N-terminal 7TM domain-containing protein, partial [Halobacteriota archaeon]